MGYLAKNKILETAVTRKLTHMLAGATTFSLFVLFPRGHSWPGRLCVAGFLCLFMVAFVTIAHLTDDHVARLPPLLRERVDRLVSNTCRTGRRQAFLQPHISITELFQITSNNSNRRSIVSVLTCSIKNPRHVPFLPSPSFHCRSSCRALSSTVSSWRRLDRTPPQPPGRIRAR